tara:strand:- start:4033 stop:5214 length:1182 start_codon:yes stop_codon:yes gene_type:complete
MKLRFHSENKILNNSGFTLIELVVVIAGLATLMVFAIPNVLNTIKLSKIEEAKALMNSYAADCLGKYRISDDRTSFGEEVPTNLDIVKLATLGYEIKENKKTCAQVKLGPIDEKDNFLYAFDFSIVSGELVKTGTPGNPPATGSLNSCRGWAGEYCGLTDAQKKILADAAALEERKNTCLSNYSKWMTDVGQNETKTWDTKAKTCTKPAFACEGVPKGSQQAVNECMTAKYGEVCEEWKGEKISDLSYKTSDEEAKEGEPKAECGTKARYWFHSGKVFTVKSDWEAYDNSQKKLACEKDQKNANNNANLDGKYTFGPGSAPSPCGDTRWYCQGTAHPSLASYQADPDCKPPANPPPPPPPPPPPCPGQWIEWCNNEMMLGMFPDCICWRKYKK